MSNSYTNIVSIDIGASGGKMCIFSYNGSSISLEDTIFFENTPIQIHNNLYWDVFGLYQNILSGLSKFNKSFNISSIGVDTFGASYGLLDSKDRLLEPVYHYRDNRTLNTLSDLEQTISKKQLFNETATQCTRCFTLPQLYSSVLNREKSLEDAKSLLFMPDLISFFMTGKRYSEKTITGTSSLLDATMNNWNYKLLENFNIPTNILENIVAPSSMLFPLVDNVKNYTGVKNAKLAATIGHDTAAAVSAIPSYDDTKIFVSIGTVIIVGIETESIFIDDEVYENGFKNTPSVCNKNIVYKDLVGFFVINELLKQFKNEGKDYSFDDIEEMAKSEKDFSSYFDISIFNDGYSDIILKIKSVCKNNSCVSPISDSQIVKSIFNSFVMKIVESCKQLQSISNIPLKEINIISGGGRNLSICRHIAEQTNLLVKVGLPRASLVGNAMGQLLALKEVSSLKQIREVTANSFEMKELDIIN